MCEFSNGEGIKGCGACFKRTFQVEKEVARDICRDLENLRLAVESGKIFGSEKHEAKVAMLRVIGYIITNVSEYPRAGDLRRYRCSEALELLFEDKVTADINWQYKGLHIDEILEIADKVNKARADKLPFPEKIKDNSGLAKLAEMIKAYRHEHGLTLREFAALCKTSHSYISMLERGKNSKTGEPMSPTVATLKRIATTINVPFVELVTMIGNVKIPNFKEEP